MIQWIKWNSKKPKAGEDVIFREYGQEGYIYEMIYISTTDGLINFINYPDETPIKQDVFDDSTVEWAYLEYKEPIRPTCFGDGMKSEKHCQYCKLTNECNEAKQ